MRLKNPLLVVTDIGKSAEFYRNVPGLEVILDFGANKTLSGGMSPRQTAKRMDVPAEYLITAAEKQI